MTSNCIINHWLLDIASAALIHQESGEQRRLGEYQLKLLVVLIQHAGQVLSREELTQMVWERRVIGNNSLPNAIHALRVALEDDGKQQRIIKTVPKKGYILEAEYCQFRRPARTAEEEDDAAFGLLPDSPPASVLTPAVPVPERPPEPPASPLPAAQPAPLPAPLLKRERGPVFFCLALLVLIAVAALVWRGARHQPPRFEPIALDNLSQIRLLRLSHTPRDIATRQVDMLALTGQTLRDLNPLLLQRNVRMDLFYSASGTSINLTLQLKSRCAQQQLAMSILNGHEHPEALRQLVRQETERKLNEMATCHP